MKTRNSFQTCPFDAIDKDIDRFFNSKPSSEKTFWDLVKSIIPNSDIEYELRNRHYSIGDVISRVICNLAEFEKEKITTAKMWRLVVEHGGPTIISKVPKNFITPKLCRIALRFGYYNFGFIPYYLQERYADRVLKRNPNAIQYFPESLKTYQRCLYAVTPRKGVNFCPNLQYVPEKFRNRKLCKIAIRHAFNIDDIPEELLDDEMFEIVLNQCVYSILLWPDKLYTYERIKKAVEVSFDPRGHYLIADNSDLYNLAKMAIKYDWRFIKSIPDHIIDKDLLLLAAEKAEQQ